MFKRILYASDYYLIAYEIRAKSIIEIQQFQPGTNSKTAFVNYLRADSHTPIVWLIDSLQEEYKTARLPHVMGKDQRNLIRHKMKRLFEYTNYTYGITQGREQDGRGDDHALFTALSHPDFLQPWLDLIITHKVPLAGICSLPLMSQMLLKHLPKAPYTLLVAHTPPVTEQSFCGLRQTFFMGKHLQFSRLTAIDAQDVDLYPDYVFAQVVKTQRYLESAQLLPVAEQTTPLSVVILADSAYCQVLKTYPKDHLYYLQIHILESHTFAQQLGLHTPLTPLYFHLLVAYQLSRNWFVNHYAKAAETRYFLYRRLRLAMYASALCLVSAGAVASYFTLEKAFDFKQKGQEWMQKTAKRQEALRTLRDQVPDLPQDILIIRNTVDMGLHLKSQHLSLEPTLNKLSEVLTQHESVLVKKLEWRIGNSAGTIFEEGPSKAPPKGQPTFRQFPPKPDPFFFEGVRMHGEISSFYGNYRVALNTFNEFITALRKKPQYFMDIKEVMSPYEAKKAMIITSDNAHKTAGKAPFIIEMFIKRHYVKKPT
jgi:hypothetical protein